MKLISENSIEAVAEKLDEGSDAAYEKAVEDFSKQQPAVFSYLFSEDIALLTEDEREYLLYLALVIWKSVLKNWLPFRHRVWTLPKKTIGQCWSL
jgi:hypothetical protein